MGKYGLPYMGSKSAIADKIIDVLPSGKRFIDLFGGGAAMSHAAALSGKYEEVLYFDADPLAVEYVRRAVAGYYSPERFKPWWVSREDFNRLKNIDPYVRYLWSFGNNPEKGYLFSRAIENEKHAAFNMKAFQSISTAVIVEPLERLQRVQSLEGLQGIQISTICANYSDFRYKRGDIVYCDPPYAGAVSYQTAFDHAAFLDWAAGIPCYISEYEMSDSRFRIYHEFKKRQLLSGANNSKVITERLYHSRYAAKEKI